MTYAEGFDEGERMARVHRLLGFRARFYGEPQSPYEEGLRDGYTPRTPGWWYGLPQTAERQAA